MWTGIIREDFPEEMRFQVALKDKKNKDHWKWVRSEDKEGVKNAHPRKIPTGQAYSGNMRIILLVGTSNGLENNLQFLRRLNRVNLRPSNSTPRYASKKKVSDPT